MGARGRSAATSLAVLLALVAACGGRYVSDLVELRVVRTGAGS